MLAWCTGFQSMHVVNNIWQASSIPTYNMDRGGMVSLIWQASSIPTYNMDRGGMVSHGLVTQSDPHQNPKSEVKRRSLAKPRTLVFTNNCHQKGFFLFCFVLFLFLFVCFFFLLLLLRDLNLKKNSPKDPNLP